MQSRCPCCYAKYDLQMILEDESSRELIQIMNKLGRPLSYHLYVYITLFKSPKRDLPPEKELRLTKEALGLSTSQSQLAQALQKVVDVMREKQVSGGFKPLKNHNYLKRVLEDVPVPVTALATLEQAQHQSQQRRVFTSKTAQAMMDLEALKTYD